eukprot:11996545-Alexandrium_andersonii.AAC.1
MGRRQGQKSPRFSPRKATRDPAIQPRTESRNRRSPLALRSVLPTRAAPPAARSTFWWAMFCKFRTAEGRLARRA